MSRDLKTLIQATLIISALVIAAEIMLRERPKPQPSETTPHAGYILTYGKGEVWGSARAPLMFPKAGMLKSWRVLNWSNGKLVKEANGKLTCSINGTQTMLQTNLTVSAGDFISFPNIDAFQVSVYIETE